MATRLIVGLGNPGKEYESTRHNVGFLTVNVLAGKLRIKPSRQVHQSLVGEGQWGGDKIVIAQPLTYMNLSGRAVRGLVKAYRIEQADLLVIHDDLDLPLGRLRLRPSGSAGGHKGLQSIIENVGTSDIARLRIGVGRPESKKAVVGYVLSRFEPEEEELLKQVLEQAAQGVLLWVKRGLTPAMNQVNAWKLPGSGPEANRESDSKEST